MTESTSREYYLLALKVFLASVPFPVLGLILVAVFKFGQMRSFLASIVAPVEGSVALVIILGVISGAAISLLLIALVVVAKVELPKNEGTELLEKLVVRPAGIATMAFCGGVFEEFFFRGVLIGLFIGHSLPVDWLIIIASSALFWAVHIPQYKGAPVVLAGVAVIGITFALMFYLTGTIVPSMIAHALYNTCAGIFLSRKLKRNLEEDLPL
ncbi:MAG: CPBP family intramembrane metalloprotease [Coriobacteriia bacterium]|nr:CPBP family intramembrane metalloprotease [Coriobacteriia bacterium]